MTRKQSPKMPQTGHQNTLYMIAWFLRMEANMPKLSQVPEIPTTQCTSDQLLYMSFYLFNSSSKTMQTPTPAAHDH